MDNVDLVRLAGLLSDERRTEPLATLADGDVAHVIAAARAHGVEPWLAEFGPKGGAWSPLVEQRARFVAGALRNRHTLDQFGTAASAAGCDWLAVKGQAVAESLYPAKHLRHGVDVDVLVDPAGFGPVLAELQNRGWQLLDQNWPLFVDSVPGQLRLLSPVGELLDLHWHLMNNPRLRRTFTLPTRELLNRRRTLPSGLPALGPDDQLIHLGIHAAESGGNRLTWLADVGFAARRVTDWPALAARAQTAGAGPALGLILLRAQHWLGTPAPRRALSAMGSPAGWQLLCRLVDRRDPIGLDPSRPALSRSFARSVESSVLSSCVEFAGHASGWLRSGAKRVRGTSVLGVPEDPRSPLFVVDDADARERYLELVAAG